MKLLSVTSIFPYPLETGGHKAQFFILNSLRKNVDLDLVCSRHETQGVKIKLRKKWKDVNIINLDSKDSVTSRPERKINFITLLRRLAIPFKWQRKISHLSPYLPKTSSVFEKKLQEYLLDNQYDLIQCEFVPCLSLEKVLPEESKKVFIHHELSFVCVERTLNTLNWWSRKLLQYQSFRKRRAELELLSKFDGIIVFSHVDKKKLSRYISDNKLYVSPFAIEINDFKTVNKQFVFKEKLLFMGGSTHYPNVDGLNWLIEKIWKKINLNIDLNILGQWSDEIIAKYSLLSNVYFQGFVPSINKFLEGNILIVPLRIGSGIRTKILEAFAAGMPVITTSIGVEGIAVEHKVHCLLADTPEEFAINIELLIRDSKLQCELSRNARLFVQKYYSIEKCTDQRESVLEQILKA